jgi:alkanesulfonate monooxygenase SsuD/methylene tetrahydromethanopterin reductase-like flavin-dependent oxidoreductase (luciferase family)
MSSFESVRIGLLILPEEPWEIAADKWRRAEALGFDHVWTYDHVVWDGLPDSPWFGAVPTLAAAGLITERIRLGTLVASPNFRHPVPFARELMTLDDISGGRITLGIGAGSLGSDADVLGQSVDGSEIRTQRFGEFVDLLDLALRGDKVTFDGRHWSTRETVLHPGCVQQPRIPFAVAASVPRTMEIAARHGSTWVTNGDRTHRGPPLQPTQGAEVVSRQLKQLQEVCEQQDRDLATIDKLVLTGSRLDSGLGSHLQFAELREAYEAVGVTDIVVHWPRKDHPYLGDEAVLEHILG